MYSFPGKTEPTTMRFLSPLPIVLSFCFGVGVLGHAQPSDRYAYIDLFRHIAIEEMQRTGIPASIKLGQGILESGGGSSELARKANNHFGIKCGPGWQGGTFYREDDDYHKGRLIKSCFRAFSSAEECYRAHSDFLTDPNKAYRYGFLFDLDPLDYKAWAKGLQKAGYATSKTYSEKLITVIEQYRLYELDRNPEASLAISPDKRSKPEKSAKSEEIAGVASIFLVNDVKVVLTLEGETPEELAARTHVKSWRLLKYNEHLDNPNQQLSANERIFLQPKRNQFRDKKKWHTVTASQNMYDISRLYGIKLEKLYKRNRMNPGEEPASGEQIRIRGTRKEAPALRPDSNPSPETPSNMAPDQSNGDFMLPQDDTQKDETPERFAPPPTQEQAPNQNLPPANTLPAPNSEAHQVYHTVEPGDTLYSISRRYQTTVLKIQELNNLPDTLISPGQRIKVR